MFKMKCDTFLDIRSSRKWELERRAAIQSLISSSYNQTVPLGVTTPLEKYFERSKYGFEGKQCSPKGNLWYRLLNSCLCTGVEIGFLLHDFATLTVLLHDFTTLTVTPHYSIITLAVLLNLITLTVRLNDCVILLQ